MTLRSRTWRSRVALGLELSTEEANRIGHGRLLASEKRGCPTSRSQLTAASHVTARGCLWRTPVVSPRLLVAGVSELGNELRECVAQRVAKAGGDVAHILIHRWIGDRSLQTVERCFHAFAGARSVPIWSLRPYRRRLPRSVIQLLRESSQRIGYPVPVLSCSQRRHLRRSRFCVLASSPTWPSCSS
jgi:hypothetical protein